MNLSGKTRSVLVLVSLILIACRNSVNSTKLNVDQNIPPSADFDASYGFWGPNGNKIYFQHSEAVGSNPDSSRQDELWEMDLKTGKRHIIHSGQIMNASISPDGKWFVFDSFTFPQYLYKMKSDGTDLQKLTGLDSPNPDWKYTVMGQWSPDASKILFDVSAGDSLGISIMNSDGSNPRILVPDAAQPRWSPDGSHIIYLNWDTSRTGTNRAQIYIADSAGNHAEKKTDLNHFLDNLNSPELSPDGKKIVFTNYVEGRGLQMFIMKVDGSDIEQVTDDPKGYVRRPEWSPDGKSILFTRVIPVDFGHDVENRLYLIDVATHQITPVFPTKS